MYQMTMYDYYPDDFEPVPTVWEARVVPVYPIKHILYCMSYNDYVHYLLDKYGGVERNYFTDETCMYRTSGISKTSRGLYIHHIDEDKVPCLSDSNVAKQVPFTLQEASHLVYANALEHLILHIKITQEAPLLGLGIGGAFLLCKEINQYYEREPEGWRYNIYKAVKNQFDDYFAVLDFFIDVIKKKRELTMYFTDNEIVKYIFCDSARNVYAKAYLRYVELFGSDKLGGQINEQEAVG